MNTQNKAALSYECLRKMRSKKHERDERRSANVAGVGGLRFVFVALIYKPRGSMILPIGHLYLFENDLSFIKTIT
jgi:hypothetical protein